MFTPTFGFGEMYDDNVALFGVRTAEGETNDYVATFFPGADLHYTGHHTSFGTRYSGSFLDYKTFSTLNRWDQRAGIELKREESAHFKWFAARARGRAPVDRSHRARRHSVPPDRRADARRPAAASITSSTRATRCRARCAIRTSGSIAR